jgi:Glycosyl hydrolases family 43
MTAFLPPRAPNRPGGTRPRSIRRRLAPLGIATAVVIAGLAWPVRAEPAPSITTRHDMPPTGPSDPATDPPQGTESRLGRSRRTAPTPRPLAPVPPADGRDAPDPFILADRGRYLLYSTQVGFHNVPVATSPNLRHWSPPSDALPLLPTWAEWGRTWAPGVARLGGRYLLYFAAHHRNSGRQCIGVAISAAATGPFASDAPDPLVCQTHLGGSIDPHPFIDHDGTPLLLWKADGNAIGQPSTCSHSASGATESPSPANPRHY